MSTENVAEAYYDSSDADNFYATVWGGEDIHIGVYAADGEPIAAASRRTVDRMAERAGELAPETRVLDIGAGYGGAARHLARRFGCHVTCLNLSERQNERNRALNEEQGLAERIAVQHGAFEEIPAGAGAFDVVWCQDALLHSGDRARVLREVQRVLRPGGRFIFTDPMQADDCPPGVLQPVLDRLQLSDMGSPGFYRREAPRAGLSAFDIDDLTPHLVRHYARVRDDLLARRVELAERCSQAYLERMVEGLGHWIDAGRRGWLAWGIMRCAKPAGA